jgi:hypothetical protein
MNIDQVLDTLQDKALAQLKAEFAARLKEALRDGDPFVTQCAEQVQHALVMLHLGQVSRAEVDLLLHKQQLAARIEAHSASIERQARLQRLASGLLDMAVDVVVKAL